MKNNPETGRAEAKPTKQELQATTPKHDLENEAERLVQEVESLALTFGPVIESVGAQHRDAVESFASFLRKKGEAFLEKDTGRRAFRVGALNYEESRRLSSRQGQAARALQTVPRSFVVSLTSVFDVFLGRLVRERFRKNEGLRASIGRDLKLAEIRQFEYVRQVEEHVLEEEIEDLIRGSRVEQFEWLSKRFDTPLTKGLDCWPRFVELSQRRNLFVHTDGVVSKQYKKVCRGVGYDWRGKEPAAGETIDASPEYFNQACSTTLEVGLKLLWVLWRKSTPSDLFQQDRSLLNVTYRLVAGGHNRVASELLSFALLERSWRFFDEDSRLRCVINLAQAHKWSGNAAKAEEVLATEDWDARPPVFRLAALVLRGRFEEAGNELPNAVSADGLEEATFVQWPLFREFRDSDAFRVAFKKAFKRDFSAVESRVAGENEEAGPGEAPKKGEENEETLGETAD